MSDREEIALLIDFENIRIRIQEEFRQATVAPRRIGKALLALAGDYGKVRVSTVYLRSDSNLTPFAQAFREEGYDFRTVLPKKSGKDRTDGELIADGVDLLHTRPELSVFILAAGDGDYVRLAQKITGAGRRLIVTCTGHGTSAELKALANPFVPIENLLGLVGPPWRRRDPDLPPLPRLDPIEGALRQERKLERRLQEIDAAQARRIGELLSQGHGPDSELHKLALNLYQQMKRKVTGGDL